MDLLVAIVAADRRRVVDEDVAVKWQACCALEGWQHWRLWHSRNWYGAKCKISKIVVVAVKATRTNVNRHEATATGDMTPR